tara:strand:+ start:359 stop:631 length:273 start_codon:yes stop_codon:yes gene_type:complete
MTEEQRVKLENLITDFEVTVVTANADWGTAEFRKYARKQKQEAHDRITDYLTVIQETTGPPWREVMFLDTTNKVEDRAGVGDDVHVEGRK